MWSFLKRQNQKQPKDEAPPVKRIVSHADLIDGMGNFSDLERDDVALKFWLPEPVEGSIEDMAGYYVVSVSMMVRILLVDYVYGRYALAYMLENQVGIARRESDVMFSRSGVSEDARPVYKVPELGKNIAAIKVWIPQRLGDDLRVLADHAGVLQARFVREIIIGAVLGRGTLPERPELRAAPSNPATEAWDSDEPVAMREVDWKEIGPLEYHEVEIVQK